MNFLIIMAALVDASLTTVSLTVYVDGVLAMAVDDLRAFYSWLFSKTLL